MNQTDETTTSVTQSPIIENRAGILFMIFLLVVSGLTASVVGYRVKSADQERKAELLATYTELGGSFEKLHQLGTTLFSVQLSPEKANFILAYEVNALRARARLISGAGDHANFSDG